MDIAVWLFTQLTLWTDSSSPENISIAVTRLSWRLIHLETDLQLWGEPAAVSVWTREEARDAEDDIVAVRIVRDAVTIRDNCPIACHNQNVFFSITDTIFPTHEWQWKSHWDLTGGELEMVDGRVRLVIKQLLEFWQTRLLHLQYHYTIATCYHQTLHWHSPPPSDPGVGCPVLGRRCCPASLSPESLSSTISSIHHDVTCFFIAESKNFLLSSVVSFSLDMLRHQVSACKQSSDWYFKNFGWLIQ